MRRWLKKKNSNQDRDANTRGLTLLELTVAVFVLALGSIAALGAVDQTRRGIGQERTRLLAGIVAQNRAENMRLLGAAAGQGLAGNVNMGAQNFQVSHNLKGTAGGLIEVTITVRSEVGPGAVMVTYLAPGLGG